jgi:hypothetical protein
MSAEDEYLVASLRCVASLVEQGIGDDALLRAWKGYVIAGPPEFNPPSLVLVQGESE